MPHDWINQKLLTVTTNSNAIYNNTVEYGFGWWFAYFWKEVASKGRDENVLKEVLAMVFVAHFPPDIAGKSFREKTAAANAVAAGFTQLLPEPVDLNARSAHYRTMLTKLLSVGFREIVNTQISRPGDAQVKDFFADRVEADKNRNPIPLAIAYRGDTREFATVIAHQGAQSRVDLGLLNMNKPWHPFSDPIVAGKMYVRGSSGDNCLYSVTSVATGSEIPVGFPLIEDRNIYSLPSLPNAEPIRTLQKWNFKMLRDAQSKLPVRLAKVSMAGVAGRPSGIFLATEGFIYAVRVKRAAHTQDVVEREFALPQDQCKERGVRGVKLKNFLAGARLRRIHLGPTRMSGTVGFVQEVRYFLGGAWVTQFDAQAFANEHFYGDIIASNRAIQMINTQFGMNTGGLIHGESDASAPNPKPVVLAIEQWNLTFPQFEAHRKAPNLYYGHVP